MSSTPKQRFATTHWSVVLAAGRHDEPSDVDALEVLFQTYWYPLYGYVRRRGYSAEDAQDLTQDFLAALLQREDLERVRPERGRFRSFLLSCMNHFLANDWDHRQAAKRGGNVRQWSLDFERAEQRFRHEPETRETAERIFERNWALAVLQRARDALQNEMIASGKALLFSHLSDCLAGSATSNYREIGTRLGMAENAVKTAVHRMRKRFRDRLRFEIEQTVSPDDDIEEEIRALFDILRS